MDFSTAFLGGQCDIGSGHRLFGLWKTLVELVARRAGGAGVVGALQ